MQADEIAATLRETQDPLKPVRVKGLSRTIPSGSYPLQNAREGEGMVPVSRVQAVEV